VSAAARMYRAGPVGEARIIAEAKAFCSSRKAAKASSTGP
jgi:hypothetical protein